MTALPARLIVVADREYAGDDDRWIALIGQVARAASGRAIAIQVRAKGLSPSQAAGLAARARAAVPSEVPLLLNGDATLAARLGYAGLHWPEGDVPDAPDALADLRYRTAAAHSTDAVRRAERAGADAVIFGAVWAPGSHAGTGAGIEALCDAARATALPVFAIGGVRPDRVAACIEVGAAGVAVVSGILGAPDVPAALDGYLAALDAADSAREGAGR